MKSKQNILRKQGLKIFKAGIRAVNPEKLIKKFLRREKDKLYVGGRVYDLSNIRKVIVVGAGKASAKMAKGVEEVLGRKIDSGIVITRYSYLSKLRRIRLIQAGHPLPDKNGLRGTKKIIQLLKKTKEKDLVICLISGGGSSLLVAPVPRVSLEDKRKTTDLLLRCGANIVEINAIRKHLSRIKGGNLAQLAYPAKVVSLILSDVPNDRMDVIASGPTVADRSNFYQCLKIIRKYDLSRKIPTSVDRYLKSSLGSKRNETPKPGSPFFKRVQNLIIGSNLLALKGCKEKAERLRFKTHLISKPIVGDNIRAAIKHTELAFRIKKEGKPISAPACIISGGETTVKVRGGGLGGRNQEFVLVCGKNAGKMKKFLILSASTDGTDGPTDAAGAFCDESTMKKAKAKGLDADEFLKNNDSYNFFKKAGGLIKIKPTGTNVMDIHLILVK
ncbi:MAG: glycerate kinase [candidate division Zixibacteria bacterium]|nr:glycerate kinase [candidate division Zixibacteria bacterium]